MARMMAVGIDAGFEGGAAAWVLDLAGCVATAGAELEGLAAQRRLSAAHGRLLDAAYAFPGSSLRGDGTRDEKMLRHVVSAGVWLATRTEPDQRAIAFPPDDAPVGSRVRDGLAFVDWYMARMAEGDGVRRRIDSKAEEWTVRKVLRRLIYHALDHAEQLERGEVRT